MKSILLLTIFLMQSIHAFDMNPFNAIEKYFTKRKYILNSEENSFPACAQFTNDEEEYYVTCNRENILTLNENLNELYSDARAIEKEVLKEDFLNQVHSQVGQLVESKIAEVDHLQNCLTQNTCDELKTSILNGLRVNLPRMRILMAQMNMPGKIYSPTRALRYDPNIEHEIKHISIPPLSTREREFAKNYTWGLEDEFSEVVKMEHPEFANAPAIVDSYVTKKFERQNKEFKKEYNSLVSSNPMLGLVAATGEESDDFLIAQALNALEFVKESLLDLKKEKISRDDRDKLILFQGTVNNVLTNENSQIYCDIASELKGEQEFSELREDIYLASAMLVGGGACAFTFGAGCVLGVAIAGEAYAIHTSVNRQSFENDLYLIGESDVETMQARNFDRDLTLYLAPLSIVGEGLGLVAKNTLKNSTNLIGNIDELRRLDFDQREALDALDDSLGIRKIRNNNIYNAGNAYNLSSGDRVYLAGIVEELKKKNYTEIEIKDYLDNLIKECNGGVN